MLAALFVDPDLQKKEAFDTLFAIVVQWASVLANSLYQINFIIVSVYSLISTCIFLQLLKIFS